MPRDLSDVLHYFLPELERAPDAGDAPVSRLGDGASERRSATRGPGAAPVRRRAPQPYGQPPTRPLSVLGVPLGERELVHAAYTWSLAVETARQGGSVAVVAPESDRRAALWPVPAPGPRSPEVVYCPATGLTALRETASDVARARSRSAAAGGIVFARIPPRWLEEGPEEPDPIRWLLTFSSPRREDASATLDRIERWIARRPGLEIGVTVHGVRRVEEARDAFDELARRCEERFGIALASYGLLTDELDVHRAIAAGRSVGDLRPDSPAARALGDVARLLYEDARSRVLG